MEHSSNNNSALDGAGLGALADWPVDRIAGAWASFDGRGGTYGEVESPFELASITKALFALAILVAVEEGSLGFDQPAGPTDSTISHLLSHSSGLAPERDDANPSVLPTLADVGSRRIYSNLGFEVLGEELAAATSMTPIEYFREAVVEPLGLTSTELYGSPAYGARSSVADLMVFTRELMAPTLVSPETMIRATTPYLPDLVGVLPGFGRQDPNPWGLGFEIRGNKKPHWTSPANSSSTFGHFGAAGTFLWIDPERALSCVVLTDRPFGVWATERWPAVSTDVLAADDA